MGPGPGRKARAHRFRGDRDGAHAISHAHAPGSDEPLAFSLTAAAARSGAAAHSPPSGAPEPKSTPPRARAEPARSPASAGSPGASPKKKKSLPADPAGEAARGGGHTASHQAAIPRPVIVIIREERGGSGKAAFALAPRGHSWSRRGRSILICIVCILFSNLQSELLFHPYLYIFTGVL